MKSRHPSASDALRSSPVIRRTGTFHFDAVDVDPPIVLAAIALSLDQQHARHAAPCACIADL
jgi:hypothetical protein